MSDLQRWLDGHGLGKLASLLAEQDIDLDILPELTEDDLEKLGLSMYSLDEAFGVLQRLLERQAGTVAASLVDWSRLAGVSPLVIRRKQSPVLFGRIHQR